MASRDWTGGYNSVFKCLGAANNRQGERQPQDYYATDPKAVDALLSVEDIPVTVCEPCCGEGHLSKRLEQSGRKVYAYDIEDRGVGSQADFLLMETLPEGCTCVITNPPYKIAAECVLKALSLLPEGGLCCMFLKTTFLEGKRRKAELFGPHPPKRLWQFSERVVCAKNGDFQAMEKTGSAVAYAWYVWEKGWKGPCQLGWI